MCPPPELTTSMFLKPVSTRFFSSSQPIPPAPTTRTRQLETESASSLRRDPTSWTIVERLLETAVQRLQNDPCLQLNHTVKTEGAPPWRQTSRPYTKKVTMIIIPQDQSKTLNYFSVFNQPDTYRIDELSRVEEYTCCFGHTSRPSSWTTPPNLASGLVPLRGCESQAYGRKLCSWHSWHLPCPGHSCMSMTSMLMFPAVWQKVCYLSIKQSSISKCAHSQVNLVVLICEIFRSLFFSSLHLYFYQKKR